MTEDEWKEYTSQPSYRQFMFLQNRLWAALNGIDAEIASKIMALLPSNSKITSGDIKALSEQIKADIWQRIDIASDSWAVCRDPHDETQVQPVVLPDHWHVSSEAGGAITIILPR